MALPTASDNAFPSLLITEGSAPSSPASGKRRLYVLSSDHLPYLKDSSGTVVALSGMTNPMTTKGDVILGDTSGVPSRLAAGTSTYVLTSNGAGAFPSWQAAGGAATGVVVTKRQGGSSTDWSSGGSTTYTPASVAVMQVGVTAAQTVATGPITVTFPQAYTNPPFVVANIGDATVNGNGLTVMVTNVTTTGFDCYPSSVPAPTTATGKVHWIAIGI